MIKESYLMVDAIAQRDNLFTRIDARLKAALAILAIAVVVGWPGFGPVLWVLALAAAGLLFVKVPARLLLIRMIPPLVMGLVVSGLLVFFQGSEQMFVLKIASFKLIGYREGFATGTVILARVAASISVLLLLSISTPVHELGSALIWFRIPRVLVEIFLLTYRYIFVLWDEGMRIRQAQTLRLGYPAWRNINGWKKAVKSTGTLMGMVFIRAYDRAERMFSALQVRAYKGNLGGRQ